MGRFMTPDWEGKPTNVPYADFGNPQSLNLYSYVENNPTTTLDLDGHCEPVCALVPLISSWVGGAIGRDGSLGSVARNVGIGSLKGLGSYLSDLPDLTPASMRLPAGDFYQPSNETQEDAFVATQIGIVGASALLPETEAAEATEALSEAATETAATVRGGETADTIAGRQAHKDFAAKVKAKPGWQSEPRLTDPATGKTVIPDALSRAGRPVELKPNSPSGRAAGKSKLKKYQRAAGKKGRVVYHQKPKP
jgi:hypothetical protein